jgi:FkbM family methyltransferase
MDIRDENNKTIDINRFEKPEQDLAKKYINKNDIVLELGARYGSVSCIINLKLNCKTNQVVVEPDKRVWKALERNRTANNCDFHIIKGFISKKKLDLTNLNSGYGTTSIENENTQISSFTLEEVMKTYDLNFNVLVADCEGFLEEFFDENLDFYNNLRLIIFEADYPNKCNYKKIENNLINKGFKNILKGHQNVWIQLVNCVNDFIYPIIKEKAQQIVDILPKPYISVNVVRDEFLPLSPSTYKTTQTVYILNKILSIIRKNPEIEYKSVYILSNEENLNYFNSLKTIPIIPKVYTIIDFPDLIRDETTHLIEKYIEYSAETHISTLKTNNPYYSENLDETI